MIKLAENRLINFIEFLNFNWPTREDVYLSVLHTYDSVQAGGERAWAVYGLPEGDGKPVIYIAGEVPEEVKAEYDGIDPEDIILEDLAHEYCHHIQNCEGRLSEEGDEKEETEAEEFATKAMDMWNNSPKSMRGWRGMSASCKEWLEGCTCAEEGDPDQCEKCTDAFLQHIKNIGKKDIRPIL